MVLAFSLCQDLVLKTGWQADDIWLLGGLSEIVEAFLVCTSNSKEGERQEEERTEHHHDGHCQKVKDMKAEKG